MGDGQCGWSSDDAGTYLELRERETKAPPNTPNKKRKIEDDCPGAPQKPVLIEMNLHPVSVSNWYYDKKQGNWQSKRTKMFITKHEVSNITKQIP